MYQSLTNVISKADDKTPNEIKRLLIHEIQNFVDEYPEYELVRYQDILKQNGIEWDAESMRNADVSKLDGRCIMALLVGVYRADYMSGGWDDGPWAELFECGCIEQWLHRLKEIDNTPG